MVLASVTQPSIRGGIQVSRGPFSYHLTVEVLAGVDLAPGKARAEVWVDATPEKRTSGTTKGKSGPHPRWDSKFEFDVNWPGTPWRRQVRVDVVQDHLGGLGD